MPYLLAYNMGHDFGVHNMSDYATTALGAHLSPILSQICDQRLSEPMPNNPRLTRIHCILRRTNFVRAFLEAVEAAEEMNTIGNTKAAERGSRRNTRLRPYAMLVDFFIAGEDVLLAEPEVKVFLKEEVVPGFARAVMMTKSNGYRSKWMRELVAKPPDRTGGRKGMCFECGESLRVEGTALVNPKSRQVVYTQACCLECAGKDENVEVLPNGVISHVKWEVFAAKKH